MTQVVRRNATTTGDTQMIGNIFKLQRSCRAVTLAAVGLIAMTAAGASAQTTTARITGTVTGDNGAPVADAIVTARSITTNLTRSARTSGNAFYALTGLTPAEYEITARRIGLQPQTKRIRVYVGQSIGLDFRLASQAVQLSGVEISAQAAAEQTERRSTEVATNITQEQMEAIPLSERNFLGLALLAPGVRRDGGSITSGAQRANNINVFVDGVSFKNDILVGGVVGQDASKGNPFPQNAVQEFRVITQQYKAEYQKATSAIITATTKSGTNNWEGNAFGLFQNENAIGRDYFTQFRCDSLETAGAVCPDKPRLDKYQIGADLGGPLVKDKLFFFGSYEGNLQTRAADVTLGTNIAGLAQKTLDSLRTFTGNFESPFRGHLGFAKLTYAPRERHRFELSANIRDEYDIRSFGLQDSYDNAEWFFNDVYTYLLKHQYTRGNALNEASVSYQYYHWNPIPLNEDKVGVRYTNVLKVGGRSTRQDFTQKRFSFRDDITYARSGWFGDHVFKVGTNIDNVIYDVIRPLNGVPQYTFEPSNGWAFPTTAAAGFGNPDLSADNRQVGFFLQDDWAPVERLTLNLGVRWDYESDMINNDWVTPDSIRSAVAAWRATLPCDGTQRVREQ
ncbi:MAG: TonB-dependent receptor, partial [Gemmatimonadaceae bacterium]|nr:TonB-dependent receptor [Gemmatimonadaceae bacterium]